MKRKQAPSGPTPVVNPRRAKRSRDGGGPEAAVCPTRKMPNELWDQIFDYLMPEEKDFLFVLGNRHTCDTTDTDSNAQPTSQVRLGVFPQAK